MTQQLIVQGFDGKHATYDVSPTDRIEDIRAKIQEKQGIPVDQQRLTFGGKDLQDGETLEDHQIKKDSTVHLLLRAIGGIAVVLATPEVVGRQSDA
jgi:ubiquitin C